MKPVRSKSIRASVWSLNVWVWATWAVALVQAAPATASSELDSLYGYRSIVVGVIGGNQEPVFSSQIRAALETEARAQPRFEVHPELAEAVASSLTNVDTLSALSGPSGLQPLTILKENKIDAGLFARIVRGENDTALRIGLIATDGTYIYRGERQVEDPKSVPSFILSAKALFKEMAVSLPFDATVLRREGYRVVLDHGMPEMYAGLKLAAYTVENREGTFALVETGRFEIVRAESRIAFGQVLVENKPYQITEFNKVRFEPVREMSTFVPLLPASRRGLASLGDEVAESPDEAFAQSAASFSRATHGRYGSVKLDLVGTALTWNRTGKNQANVGSDSGFFPGVALQGELWMTRNWLVQGGLQLAQAGFDASSGTGASSLNAQVSQLYVDAGYRFRLVDTEMAPKMTARLGFGQVRYGVDTTSASLAPSAGNYSGIRLGLGIDVPVSEKFSAGLDTTYLGFASYVDAASSSVDSASGWSFGGFAKYFLTRTLELEMGLSFQANSVTFTTPTTNSVASASQNQRRLSLGARYYF